MRVYDFQTETCQPLDLEDGDGITCVDDATALREAALTAAAMAKDELAGSGLARCFTILVKEGGRLVGTVRVDVSIDGAGG